METRRHGVKTKAATGIRVEDGRTRTGRHLDIYLTKTEYDRFVKRARHNNLSLSAQGRRDIKYLNEYLNG